MSAWEKFQLGWLNYESSDAGASRRRYKLGPAEYEHQAGAGLFVVLPDKQVDVRPRRAVRGLDFYYSGSGNDLDNTMTKSVTLPAGRVAHARRCGTRSRRTGTTPT